MRTLVLRRTTSPCRDLSSSVALEMDKDLREGNACVEDPSPQDEVDDELEVRPTMNSALIAKNHLE